MKHNIEFSRRLLRYLYEAFLMTLVFYYVEVILIKEAPDKYITAYTFFILGCSYIIRELAKRHIFNILGHAVIALPAFALPMTTGVRITCIVICVYVLFDAMGYTARNGVLKPLTDVPWPSLMLCVIIYVFGHYTDSSVLKERAYITVIMLLVIYFFMVYFDGLKGYVEATKDVSGLPLKNIISRNSAIVIMVIGLLILGIFLGRAMKIDVAIHNFFRGIVAMIGLVVYGIFFLFKLFINMFANSGEGGSFTADNYWNENTREAAGKVGLMGDFLIKLVLALLLLFVATKIVGRLIKVLFSLRRNPEDIIEASESSKKDQINIRQWNIFKSKLSNEEKIRKYYKTRVLRERYDVLLTKTKTCRQIEEELKEKEVCDLTEITDIYADVRYGDVVPDKGMVKRVSTLSRK